MKWRMPIFLWAMLLPAVLLIGWCLAEYLRRRRLRIFGDPAIMGVSDDWALRIGLLLLFLSGFSAAVALLPLPVSHVKETAPPLPAISLLLDSRSLDYAGDRLWNALEDTVEILLLQAPGAHFRVLASGLPREVLVPATVDVRGIQDLLGRLKFERAQGARIDLGKELPPLSGLHEAIPWGHTVILTAMPEDEMNRLETTISKGSADVTIAWISEDGSIVRFGTLDGLEGWIWHDQPTRLGELMKSSLKQQPPTSRMSVVQWLALASLLLLWGESLGNLVPRTGGRKVPRA